MYREGLCEKCPIKQVAVSRQQVLIAKRDAFSEATENNTCALGPMDLTYEESKLVTACLNRQAGHKPSKQCELPVDLGLAEVRSDIVQ